MIRNVKKGNREGAPKQRRKENLTVISYIHRTSQNFKKVDSRFGVNVLFFFTYSSRRKGEYGRKKRHACVTNLGLSRVPFFSFLFFLTAREGM